MIGHLYRYPHPFDPTKFIYVGQGAKRDGRHRSGETSFGRRFKHYFPNVDLPQPIRKEIEILDKFELNELETIWMFRYHTWHGYEGGMNLMMPGSQDYRNSGSLSLKSQISKNPDHQSKAGKLGGRKTFDLHGPFWTFAGSQKAGLKNIESGHITYRIHQLPQSKQSKRNNGFIRGRIQGFKNLESGHIQALGCKFGKDAVVTGRLASYRTVEHQSKAGQIGGSKKSLAKTQACEVNSESGRHAGWHVNGRKDNRGKWRNPKPNPRCVLCSEQNLVIAYA